MVWNHNGKWSVVGLVALACLWAIPIDPRAKVSRVPYNHLVGGRAVPAEAVYLHSRSGCRLAECGVERLAIDRVPADAMPCPSCRLAEQLEFAGRPHTI